MYKVIKWMKSSWGRYYKQGKAKFLHGKQLQRRNSVGVKTETINKVCASGMRSVTLADQLIRLGDEEIIVAGGMESMSNAPYYYQKSVRFKNGRCTLVDGMIYDGLTCSFSEGNVHMGTYGNSTANDFSLTVKRRMNGHCVVMSVHLQRSITDYSQKKSLQSNSTT